MNKQKLNICSMFTYHYTVSWLNYSFRPFATYAIELAVGWEHYYPSLIIQVAAASHAIATPQRLALV